MFQGLDCSSFKALRELGSERRETVWSISGEGVRVLKNLHRSTRGFGMIRHSCASFYIHLDSDMYICLITESILSKKLISG